MAKKNQYGGAKRARKNVARDGRSAAIREVPVYEPKEKVEYGAPFIVMEDRDKNTFSYDGAAWVPYEMTMADCRLQCQVKVLPQKVNGKTRYEVRAPLV